MPYELMFSLDIRNIFLALKSKRSNKRNTIFMLQLPGCEVKHLFYQLISKVQVEFLKYLENKKTSQSHCLRSSSNPCLRSSLQPLIVTCCEYSLIRIRATFKDCLALMGSPDPRRLPTLTAVAIDNPNDIYDSKIDWVMKGQVLVGDILDILK